MFPVTEKKNIRIESPSQDLLLKFLIICGILAPTLINK